jgi:hypothetical protein
MSLFSSLLERLFTSAKIAMVFLNRPVLDRTPCRVEVNMAENIAVVKVDQPQAYTEATILQWSGSLHEARETYYKHARNRNTL